jgi:hypothetical protein
MDGQGHSHEMDAATNKQVGLEQQEIGCGIFVP